jgi:hypothetical protein
LSELRDDVFSLTDLPLGFKGLGRACACDHGAGHGFDAVLMTARDKARIRRLETGRSRMYAPTRAFIHAILFRIWRVAGGFKIKVQDRYY